MQTTIERYDAPSQAWQPVATVAQIPTVGATRLLGFTATIARIRDAHTIEFTVPHPTLRAAHADIFKGTLLRPDVTVTGPGGDWSQAGLLHVTGNTATSVSVAEDVSALATGTTMRTMIVVDRLRLGNLVHLESQSDIYVRREVIGQGTPANLTFSSSTFVLLNGAAYRHPGYVGDEPTYDIVTNTIQTMAPPASGRIRMNGGELTLSGSWSSTAADALSMASGTLHVAGSLIIPNTPVVVSGGSLDATGDVTVRSVNISGSPTISARDLLVLGDVAMSGGTVTVRKIDTDPNATGTRGDINVTGGSLVVDDVRAHDLTVTHATLAHAPTTSTTVHRFVADLSGSFDIDANATIDVSGLGYPGGYSYGPSGPSTALAGAGFSGGSHGGAGGGAVADVGPTYDDFRAPFFPGSGGQGGKGGGIIRITAAGACSLGPSAKLLADGTSHSAQGAAGGSIWLKCATLGGPTAAGAVSAAGSDSDEGGGGGRIALVSTGASDAHSGGFDPTNASFATTVVAAGGTSSASAPGGAGTIFVQTSDRPNGSLIIDNAGTVRDTTGGATALNVAAETDGTPLNGGNIYAAAAASTLATAATGTPFAAAGNIFAGGLLHLFSVASGQRDPRHASHLVVPLAGNTTTAYQAATGSTFPLADMTTHQFYVRHVLHLDHLVVRGKAELDMRGADLLLERCDIADLNGAGATDFSIGVGSKIVNGGAMASAKCVESSIDKANVIFADPGFGVDTYYLP